jgi:enoyl-CoA hydratase/carnithine racemase
MTTVTTDRDGGVLLVTMNRPEALNAFSSQLMDDLADAFIGAAEDDAVKVVVLTGAGRAFSAGADLTEMGRPADPPKHGFPGLLDAIIELPKPLLLAINGLGVGIGATICGLADMAWIAAGARLRCPFSALGLTAEAASTYTLPLLMGRQRANWFLLAAEWLTATEAVEAGLALEVVDDDGLLDHVLGKARILAALPSSSLQATKSLIMAPVREQLKNSAMEENRVLASLVGTPANREALAAFVEKRAPDFSAL